MLLVTVDSVLFPSLLSLTNLLQLPSILLFILVSAIFLIFLELFYRHQGPRVLP